MKKQWIRNGLLSVMMLALVGLTTHALAQQGNANRKGDGTGKGNRPYDCPRAMDDDWGGRGWKGLNITDTQRADLEKERTAFFNDSAELRRQIKEKQIALAAEMVKKEPSVETASNIQKEISQLESELDQQRLQHQFRMKKIAPEIGMGWGKYHGRGMRGNEPPCMR